ncbi:hypothetical protein OPT61_g1466 [Boeremia exigua]|uniref:Uncharacterized protein n=1 Tax=Boeremia exigua TaxID=749465 RepID=A0ACC2IQB2_9PLEO|nr:hypothetical protein OPT61_g1466 [Boeremia exigua]
MTPAPLSFLRQRLPHRNKTAHLTTLPFVDFDGRRSFSITFVDQPALNSPSITQTLPPNSKGKTSHFNPPPHYHVLQDEYFRVISGKGIWHLWDDTSVILEAGQEIRVPVRKYHWFQNCSDTEPLVVGHWYDEARVRMEEIFFRNVLSYFADCLEMNVQPSKFQMALFGWNDLLVFGLVHTRFLPSAVEFVINIFICGVMAFIAKYLLGYKDSYAEYYKPAIN